MLNSISRIAAGGFSAIIMLGAIAGGASYAESVVVKNGLIDEETAEEFALLDADLEEEDIQGMKIVLERNDGIYVYDISFYSGTTEYEYEIQAKDGVVLEKDVETKTNGAKNEAADTRPAAEENVQSGENNSVNIERTKNSAPDDTANIDSYGQKTDSTKYISVDKAKQIALDNAGLSADEVRFSKAKLEKDDDGIEYEVEFYKGQMEYEYEIDAVTGRILDSSVEIDND